MTRWTLLGCHSAWKQAVLIMFHTSDFSYKYVYIFATNFFQEIFLQDPDLVSVNSMFVFDSENEGSTKCSVERGRWSPVKRVLFCVHRQLVSMRWVALCCPSEFSSVYRCWYTSHFGHMVEENQLNLVSNRTCVSIVVQFETAQHI